MRRIRVTGRFYVFLAMVAVGLFFIAREFIEFGPSEAIIMMGSASYEMRMDAVVVRNESVASHEGNGRVIYLAAEGSSVHAGQSIAEVYSAEYSIKAFEKLENTRKEIRAYYQTVLNAIKDPELERLEGNVQAQALELKRLIKHKSTANLINVQKSLEDTMRERQEYLRANRREDLTLNNYYNLEASQSNSIAAWKTEMKAPTDGVVSFYLDGYESSLTPESLEDISIETVQAVIDKKPLTQAAPNARLRHNVFKVVSSDKWYVVLLSNDPSWNPMIEQSFQMQMEGVNGFMFMGKVVALHKSGSQVLARIEIETSLGPMLDRRSGKVSIAGNVTGFTVPNGAIFTEDGKTGVRISDVAGGTFVPVDVLSSDSRYSLVQPITEGTLQRGWRVLIP